MHSGPVSWIDDLRDHLVAADYRVDPVLARLGVAGQAGLERNSTIPAQDALAGDHGPLATLIRLFPLSLSVPVEDVAAALPLPTLQRAGLVETAAGRARAMVDLRPYGFPADRGQWDGWIVSDHTPGLDTDRRPTRPDYVLGVSPASTTLAQLTIPDRVGSALDLGTGSGVQSMHLSTHASRITATDINPRCLEHARLTAALNEVDVDLRAGSLYEPVADEQFDLIVTNPPYVMSPPITTGRLVYREAGLSGDELVRRLVADSTNHLTPGGSCQVLANWAILDQPWHDRLAGWAPPGADLWVIERERLDPYAYIEMWLADAGLAGDPRWPAAYREWLDYFEHLGVRGVGMGWITVVNAQRDQPDITIETWPHDVQAVGPAISAHRHAVTNSRLPDAELLATNFKLRSDVVGETMGVPGATDPQYVVLRQTTGLKRAMAVDTALGGVLGACDGSLPLGAIIDAVSNLLAEPSGQLRQALLPVLRTAVVEDYLRPVSADGSEA